MTQPLHLLKTGFMKGAEANHSKTSLTLSLEYDFVARKLQFEMEVSYKFHI